MDGCAPLGRASPPHAASRSASAMTATAARRFPVFRLCAFTLCFPSLAIGIVQV
jgi:hypothetical protein